MRLAKYRSALEAGVDATVVAGWMREVQAERLAAERLLLAAKPTAAVTPEDIRTLVAAVGDAVELLAEADTELKAQLYADLGISLLYDPERAVVQVEALPWTSVRVEGGT